MSRCHLLAAWCEHYKIISGVEYAYYTHIWEMENITGWDVYHG